MSLIGDEQSEKVGRDIISNSINIGVPKYMRASPDTDPINENEPSDVPKLKEKRKLKYKSDVGQKELSVASSPPQQMQSSIKSLQKAPANQTKSIEIKHNVVPFEFIEPLSNLGSQSNRFETPKTKNVTSRSNRKSMKQQQLVPENLNNKKIQNNLQRSSITELLGNQINIGQTSQTPRLVLSRYGANRRLQAQKEQQTLNSNSRHLFEKQESPCQKQTQPIMTQKPQGLTRINRPQGSNFSTPPPSKTSKDSKTQRLNTVNTNSPQNEQSQGIRKLQRKTGRSQLKTRNKQSLTENKNKPKIILYVIKKIIYTKLTETLAHVKAHSYRQKIKFIKFAQLLIIKIRSVYNHIINDLYTTSFNKINKYNTIKNGKQNKKNNKLQNIENMVLKSKKIMVSYLSRLFRKKLSAVFIKMNGKKITVHRNKIINVLDRYFNRKLAENFKNLVLFSKINFTIKCQYTGRIFIIMKEFYCKIYSNAFRKIKFLKKKQDNQKDKNSRPSSNKQAQDNTSISSARNTLVQLSKQVQKNTRKLTMVIEQTEKQKQQYQNKIDKIKILCQELKLKNEEKKKISIELKERVQSIQLPEQPYIQQTDTLTETKFPILYELYVKIQKSGMDEIKINDLLHSFQFLEQEMKKDPLVKSWVQILQNHQKKKQISQYEGEMQRQRIAAKKVHEEQLMLVEMIRGYIKEKYTWELVKNALSNISIET